MQKRSKLRSALRLTLTVANQCALINGRQGKCQTSSFLSIYVSSILDSAEAHARPYPLLFAGLVGVRREWGCGPASPYRVLGGGGGTIAQRVLTTEGKPTTQGWRWNGIDTKLHKSRSGSNLRVLYMSTLLLSPLARVRYCIHINYFTAFSLLPNLKICHVDRLDKCMTMDGAPEQAASLLQISERLKAQVVRYAT